MFVFMLRFKTLSGLLFLALAFSLLLAAPPPTAGDTSRATPAASPVPAGDTLKKPAGDTPRLSPAEAPKKARDTTPKPPLKPIEYYLASLPICPFDDSAEHQAELELVLRARNEADDNVQERVRGAMDFRMGNFLNQFRPIVGPWLTEEKTPVTVAFLNQVAEQVQPVCDGVKERIIRVRPPEADSRIKPLTDRRLDRLSYPSGHAFRAYFLALVLAELFPGKAEALRRKGLEIGWDRIAAGLHHPSDIFAGRTLAAMAFRDLSDSPAFREGLAQAKAELAAVGPAGS